MRILSCDPGKNGAFVLMDGAKILFSTIMPLNFSDEPCFRTIYEMVTTSKADHIFLERAQPMAMGSKHAFNYGRGFAAIEIAVLLSEIPVTFVEPLKWMKVIHEGINQDLKPKARSLIALERLRPDAIPLVAKNTKGKMHDGIVDAILIAEYGRRQLGSV